MNKKLKMILTAVFLALAGLLTACGDPGVSYADAQKLRELAREEGARNEIVKAEQRYLVDKQSVEQLARDTVNKANLRHSSGCSILPKDVVDAPAYKALAQTGKSVYWTACEKQIGTNIAAEKQKARDEAFAQKQRQQKLAAKRAKAEELAAKQQKRRHASTAQPIRPQAVKPVAKADRRS